MTSSPQHLRSFRTNVNLHTYPFRVYATSNSSYNQVKVKVNPKFQHQRKSNLQHFQPTGVREL